MRIFGSVVASTLDPEGPVAREIEDLWWFMLLLGVAVFGLFAVLLLAGIRRSASSGDRASLRPWLLGGGVVLPVVVILVVLVATLGSMDAVADDAPDEALTVEVIGHQWWWEFRYPQHDVVTANELHIPAGTPVELRLTSGDVIHSFWVPALAGKRDLVPEDVTTLVLEADEPGRYAGRCAEFCGLQHALMELFVVAEDGAEFRAWLDEQAQPASAPRDASAERGMELFSSEGCAGCHTVRGTEASGDRGPDLTHLMSRETIAAGTLETTRDDLRSWVDDPHASKRGVEMPAVTLGDDDLADIVAYLEGLE